MKTMQGLTSLLFPGRGGGGGGEGGEGGHRGHVAVPALAGLEAEPALIKPKPPFSAIITEQG